MTTAAWRIETLAANAYRFINVSGDAADDIVLTVAAETAAGVDDTDSHDDSATVDGPLDHVLGASTSPYYFDVRLAAGRYTLHWQAVASASSCRTTPFTLPPSGMEFDTLFHRAEQASDDEAPPDGC